MSTPARLLVVEDEGIISAHLQSTLRRLGYTIAGATDGGIEALRLAEELKPDLVLMDIVLAGALDGIAAAAILRERRGPPVIFMTSHADTATLAKANATAPVGYLTKPFAESSLGAAIEVGLRQGALIERLTTSQAEALRANEQATALAHRYELLLRLGSDGVHLLDERGHLVEVNDRFCQLLGYSREELLGRHVSSWDAKLTETEIEYAIASLLARPATFESRHRRKDGSTFDAEITATCVELEGRALLFNSSRDITERKQAEAERLSMERALQAARKSESLGAMAAGIAHNLNNRLMAVLGNLDLAREEATGPTLELLNEARVAARGAAGIGAMMRTYLGQGGAARTPLAIADEIRALVQLVRPLLSASVRLELACASDSPTCTLDRAEFQQLVRSIVSNASEAVLENGGGLVSVSLRRMQSNPPDSRDWAELEIRDNGIGMEPATLERIFDPFFTTKFTGRGLGLSTAQGIVRAMQGTITVESQRGQGTQVTIRIPASSAEEKERAQQEAASAAGKRGPITDTALSVVRAAQAAAQSSPARRRVLLVDDDPLVRSATLRLLKRQGCEVLQASDGNEALALFAAQEGRIDCVLLDLSMPGMDGWEVLAALRHRDPKVYVVLASGYDVDQLRAEQRDVVPNGWLQKPYSLHALASILSR